MKASIAAVALFASAALAQDLSALPSCGANCITSMLGLAGTLGCSSTDVACLCSNSNFGYGVRDCSAQACPAGTDLSGINQYAIEYCGNPAASSGTFSPSGAATSALTESGTVTIATETSTETAPNSTATGDSEAVGGGAAITTSEILSTITTDGSTITSTVGSTTIFSSAESSETSGSSETSDIGASASSVTSGAGESISSAASSASSVISSAASSATSALRSATSAAGGSTTSAAGQGSSTGGAYPMATVAFNGVAGIAGLAALLAL